MSKGRTRRNGAKSGGTKKPDGNAVLRQHRQALHSLQQQVTVLQTNFERLVEVHQQNHQHLLTAFHMTDAHLWVMKQVQQDHIGGKIKLTGVGEIDYPAYYQAFNEHHQAQLEAARAAAQEEAKPEDDGPVEFGGDYGETAVDSDGSEGADGQGGGEDDGEQPQEDPVPPVQHPGVAVAEQ
jgi:hypothetical protein